MKIRSILLVVFTFCFVYIIAQPKPKVIAINYVSETEAVLIRNNPADLVTYYWQGTSCGISQENANKTYTATTSTIIYIRAYINSLSMWDANCSSTVVAIPDLPPVLIDATTGTIPEGVDIMVTSNERGMIYLVPAGTAANVSAITTAKVAEIVSYPLTARNLSTAGVAVGEYILYAIDETNHVSLPSDLIRIADVTNPVLSDVTSGTIEPGTAVSATSNENGSIHLVPNGTAQNISAILAASVSEGSAVSGTPVSLSTAGISLGEYIVYAVDLANNVSVASPSILLADLTAPVLSDVTVGPVDGGDVVNATSNEAGMIYLVPTGTPANVGDITGAQEASAAASAGLAVELPTSGVELGEYIVYALDASNNVSDPSPAITIADLSAPILSDVTVGPVKIGDDINATSNEDGVVYLVPVGTAPNAGDITSAKVTESTAIASSPVALSTTFIDAADYIVYAIDAANNVSDASASITVESDATSFRSKHIHSIIITPTPVDEVLSIKSDIHLQQADLYSIQGILVRSIINPGKEINLISLQSGMYILRLKLDDNTIFTRRIIKK